MNAQFCLGYCCEFGQGVTKDDVEAAKWYRKAADQGHDKARICLGHCYEIGLGVPMDLVLAHMWYNLSLAAGYAGAAEYRETVAHKMTPEQIAEAERKAREWKPKKEEKANEH